LESAHKELAAKREAQGQKKSKKKRDWAKYPFGGKGGKSQPVKRDNLKRRDKKNRGFNQTGKKPKPEEEDIDGEPEGSRTKKEPIPGK